MSDSIAVVRSRFSRMSAFQEKGGGGGGGEKLTITVSRKELSYEKIIFLLSPVKSYSQMSQFNLKSKVTSFGVLIVEIELWTVPV